MKFIIFINQKFFYNNFVFNPKTFIKKTFNLTNKLTLTEKLKFSNSTRNKFNTFLTYFITLKLNVSDFWFLKKSIFSSNYNTLISFIFILFIDSLLTDDEPLWEPIEWSLVQTWILFLFSFSWIFENLISSRYGSYVGRDKRVWLGWFKTYWMLEIFYALNYGAAAVFVITPFANETKVTIFYLYSWWNWFNRVFMFKFIFIFFLMLSISYYMQINSRWMNWKKSLLLTALVIFLISYILFSQYIILFFGYLTDPTWHQKYRAVDYIQLSHGPSKWGHADKKKDHFYQHASRSVFWFKNDSPFAASFIMFHFFFVFSLFLLFIYWVSLFRRISSTREVPLTFLTYCTSSIRHFLNCFLMFYFMIFLSFFYNYCRLPFEFNSHLDTYFWHHNLYSIVLDYPSFIVDIFLKLL